MRRLVQDTPGFARDSASKLMPSLAAIELPVSPATTVYVCPPVTEVVDEGDFEEELILVVELEELTVRDAEEEVATFLLVERALVGI